MTDENLEYKNTKNDLRRIFVGMLFALVVATWAEQFADFLFVLTDGWNSAINLSRLVCNLVSYNGLMLAPLFHSILALLLVSTSWVMWSKSKAAGHGRPIDTLNSLPFILLLLEVVLVVLYFALVGLTEQNITSFNSGNSLVYFVQRPSALPEAQLLSWIFAVYALWDFLADVIDSPVGKPYEKVNSLLTTLTGIITYCSVSLLCFIACIFVCLSSLGNQSPIEAVIGDTALLVVLIWFRVGKRLEGVFTKYIPWESTRENTIHGRQLNKLDILYIGLPLIVFVLCLWLI